MVCCSVSGKRKIIRVNSGPGFCPSFISINNFIFWPNTFLTGGGGGFSSLTTFWRTQIFKPSTTDSEPWPPFSLFWGGEQGFIKFAILELTLYPRRALNLLSSCLRPGPLIPTHFGYLTSEWKIRQIMQFSSGILVSLTWVCALTPATLQAKVERPHLWGQHTETQATLASKGRLYHKQTTKQANQK